MERMPFIAAPVALLVLACCGSLDNSPLRVGVIRGSVQDVQAGVALASVLGRPELRATPDGQGRFEIRSVPAGPVELLVVASSTGALRVTAQVRGGGITELGTLSPQPAAFAQVHVSTPGKQSTSGARVQVVGTPYQGLTVAPDGTALVGPLAAGCYDVQVALPGLGVQDGALCVSSGEQAPVPVAFPAPDGSPGRDGCVESGCFDGLHCAPDGNCVECLSQADCGAGLSCQQNLCQGLVPPCARCSGDWQCQAAEASCEEENGEPICVFNCSDTLPCPQPGFTCQAGICLPDPAHAQGCPGYLFVGAACTSDDVCRSGGLPDGLCLNGQCTHPCAVNNDCPAGYSCASTAAGPVCSRP